MTNNLVLSLDLALIRWSVVCKSWDELSANNYPLLGAFLAGWYSRCCGVKVENEGQFRDSFRVGWREADSMIEIELRNNSEK